MQELGALKELTVDRLVYVFVLLMAIRKCVDVADWAMTRFGIKTKWSEARHRNEELIKQHEEQIDVHGEYLNELTKKVDHLCEVVEDMKRENAERDRKHIETLSANLKDRIGQSYRYYHKQKYWNEMEREAFNSLIHQYEELGNENSFVHTICEPESLTWEIREND